MNTEHDQQPTPKWRSVSLKVPFVLDTSLFSNPDTQVRFGGNMAEAIQHFVRISEQEELDVYMPLSIFRELSNFGTLTKS